MAASCDSQRSRDDFSARQFKRLKGYGMAAKKAARPPKTTETTTQYPTHLSSRQLERLREFAAKFREAAELAKKQKSLH